MFNLSVLVLNFLFAAQDLFCHRSPLFFARGQLSSQVFFAFLIQLPVLSLFELVVCVGSLVQGKFYLIAGLQFCTWCRSSAPSGCSISRSSRRNLLSMFSLSPVSDVYFLLVIFLL
jgi:hypothetical protein